MIDKFIQIADNPSASVAAWKEQNRKQVIGLLPMRLPEEIIHAVGILPVVLWSSNEPITTGLAYAPTHHCGFNRSFIDQMVRGSLDFIDGMIFYDVCLVARGAIFCAERHNPPKYLKYIHIPCTRSQAARDYAVNVLKNMKTGLEELTGRKIADADIQKSIAVYNENRDLLSQLYQIRRKNPGILTAREMVAIVHASALMPKEEHSALLKKLIAQLMAKKVSDKRVKVVLSGHFCDPPRADVLDIIEGAGAVVVDDDLYWGSRYFAHNVSLEKDPFTALMERYMADTPPDPTMQPMTKAGPEEWGDFLAAKAKQSGAQGVISLMVKFCPPHQEYHPDARRALNAAGIRELMLQMEREAVTIAPVRTRVDAFVESIREVG